jgi:hypothetical protein
MLKNFVRASLGIKKPLLLGLYDNQSEYLQRYLVLNGAPAPNPGLCFALFDSLPAAPTAQTNARGQQNRAILHNTHALCAMRGQEKRLPSNQWSLTPLTSWF